MEYPDTFMEVWNRYPAHRKLGKKGAYKSFRSTVKTKQDLEDLHKALTNYLSKIKHENTQSEYIKQADTFFNNWEDYVDYVCLETAKAEEAEKAKQECIAYANLIKGVV